MEVQRECGDQTAGDGGEGPLWDLCEWLVVTPRVFSYGGGRNGTGLAIEALRRGLRPDVILFADTGGERDTPGSGTRLE